MKGTAFLFCAAGVCASFVRPASAPKTPVLVIAGETLGYLSPCGCTQPMTGGILRFGSALRRLEEAGPTMLLYDGGLVDKTTRQDELKSETMAQALGAWHVAAANLALKDARLGSGQLLTLNRLEGNRMVTSSLAASPSNPAQPYLESNGFLIAGVSDSPDRLAKLLDESAVPLDSAVQAAMARAKAAREQVILLLDGDRKAALELAKRYPKLALITYRTTGSPSREVERVGAVVLVTPGERGQYLVSLRLRKSGMPSYSTQKLDPTVQSDPRTEPIYRTYLDRVSQERLWEKTPRVSGDAYAGSEKCGSCHQQAYKVWKGTGHAHAFETLASQGHGQDPECLPCHIVGGRYKSGFQSGSTTLELAAVGCESCHGSGAEHARDPWRSRLQKAGSQSCNSCHEPLNSPNFEFPLYWAQIRHHL